MKTTVKELMQESGVAFGTSGARGLVSAMTDRVCYGYTAGFLGYMAEQGEFAPGGEVALAGDLRPSTPRILAACAQRVRDMGGSRFLRLCPNPCAGALCLCARHSLADGHGQPHSRRPQRDQVLSLGR
jgi:phosphomannomutase